ncbi:MAG TPA: hypothetical protein VF004_13875, partial [Burkholderiales bacterium]
MVRLGIPRLLRAGTTIMFAAGLRETAPSERRSLHPADIARTWLQILSDARFVAPFLLVLCAH